MGRAFWLWAWLAWTVSMLIAAPSLATNAQTISLPASLVFLTPTLGWLQQGTDMVPGKAPLEMTTDGGAHWRLVSQSDALTMAFRTAHEGAVAYVAAVDACEALFATETTSDGGRHWRPYGTIAGTNGRVALAYAGTMPLLLNGSCMSPTATLYALRGKKPMWTRIASLTVPTPDRRSLFSPSALSMRFSSPYRGLAVIAYTASGTANVPRLWVYTSSDGGWQWAARPMPAPAAGQIMAVSFADTQHGLVALASSSGECHVYVTVDGGRQWAPARGVAPGTDPLLDLITPEDGVVVLVRSSGKQVPLLWRTHDGGRHWQAFPVP